MERFRRILYGLGLVLALGSVGASASKPDVRSYLWAKLPAKLQSLKIDRSNRDEVLRVLGKPGRDGGDSLFYHLATFDYDTVLSFKKRILRKIEYRFAPKEMSLVTIRKEGIALPDGGLDPAVAEKQPHAWGREREIRFNEERMTLIHETDEARSLRSVEFR